MEKFFRENISTWKKKKLEINSVPDDELTSETS